jgi:hypothetical protein
MATLLELVAANRLVKFDPHLEVNELEWRFIYALPRFRERVENDLTTWESSWKVESTPAEQLDALFEISGETLTYHHQFKLLKPIRDGIWELKTPDLRLFGWFPIKDCFIGGALDLAFNVKKYGLYAGYIGEVVRLRDKLDLDEPKFVAGEDPNAVVSNCDFP